MTAQRSLFDYDTVQTAHRPLTIEEKFEAFLAKCPDFYPAFVRVALRLKRSGKDRHSADACLHYCRWERLTSGEKDDDGWKCNNSYSALLARKAMKEYPELDGFFETRRRRGESP